MTIPDVTTHQDRLLTLNIGDAPLPALEGVSLTPLFLDRENGVWVMYGRFAPGTVLPAHLHTGSVHFFTTKGRWAYREYPDDPQVAGSYLYEPGGSMHTFTVPADASEDAEGFFVINGANLNFLDGVFQNVTDAGSLEEMLRAFAAATSSPLRFISPGRAAIRKTDHA
jgi:2,4'-dihydroxyacetophenone dioxygenase